MVIGILQAELVIHDCQSLKDKRRVVHSLKDRLQREHLVSVAEVGDQEVMNAAVLGVACVARDGARAGEILDHVTEKLRACPDAELGETTREILNPREVGGAPGPAPTDGDALAREMIARAREQPR